MNSEYIGWPGVHNLLWPYKVRDSTGLRDTLEALRPGADVPFPPPVDLASLGYSPERFDQGSFVRELTGINSLGSVWRRSDIEDFLRAKYPG